MNHIEIRECGYCHNKITVRYSKVESGNGGEALDSKETGHAQNCPTTRI